jgi:hypothetical protein
VWHALAVPDAPTRVYLESGTRRVFAGALDWPGWCRSGRDGEGALAALAAAATRYAPVAAEAGLALPAVVSFDVVERVPGSATTEFGVPAAIPAHDTEPTAGAEAERLAALVSASWAVLERVVGSAPASLRKGPRGGGRDRDRIVEHVLGAEVAYARKLGIRAAQPGVGDAAAISAFRRAIIEILDRASDGAPAVSGGWPARYAARRIAWHALDHAWEIEDRGTTP